MSAANISVENDGGNVNGESRACPAAGHQTRSNFHAERACSLKRTFCFHRRPWNRYPTRCDPVVNLPRLRYGDHFSLTTAVSQRTDNRCQMHSIWQWVAAASSIQFCQGLSHSAVSVPPAAQKSTVPLLALDLLDQILNSGHWLHVF